MKFVFPHLCSLPVNAVFAFHCNPASLAVLFAGHRSFRMLQHDGHIEPGASTWFEQTVCGCIPTVMGFRHTAFDPPHYFAEELIHGPFKKFTHAHEFQSHEGETLILDYLDIELPWHYGGELAMRFIVAPMIRRAFAIRGQRLTQLCADGHVRTVSDQHSPLPEV